MRCGNAILAGIRTTNCFFQLTLPAPDAFSCQLLCRQHPRQWWSMPAHSRWWCSRRTSAVSPLLSSFCICGNSVGVSWQDGVRGVLRTLEMRTLFLLSLLMKLFLAGAHGLSRAEMSLPVMSPTGDVISGCDYCDSSFTGITVMSISDIQEWNEHIGFWRRRARHEDWGHEGEGGE